MRVKRNDQIEGLFFGMPVILCDDRCLLIEPVFGIASSGHQPATFGIDRRLFAECCTEISCDTVLSKAEERVTGRTPVSHMSIDLRTPIVRNPLALLQGLT